jgi:hypothetical protein
MKGAGLSLVFSSINLLVFKGNEVFRTGPRAKLNGDKIKKTYIRIPFGVSIHTLVVIPELIFRGVLFLSQ